MIQAHASEARAGAVAVIKHRLTLPPEAHRLIDEFMPNCDVSEYHETEVRAHITTVYDALRTTDFSSSPVIRVLLRLRGLPGSLSRGPKERDLNLNLDAIAKRGFVLLGENPPNEIAFGLIGRFWTLGGGTCRVDDAVAFNAFDQPGYAKAVWNFSLVEEGVGRTRLATETRVLCLGDASRRRFRLYWALIASFSGLIRREILRAIRTSSEFKL